MEPWVLDVLIGVAIVFIVIGIVWAYDRARTRNLRQQFGPEYERTVAEFGDRRKGESELLRRQNRFRRMHLRDLSPIERDRFREEWRRAQSRFVDDPDVAVLKADRLLDAIMDARGYSAVNLDERIDNVSTAYPSRADDYRQAVAIVTQYRQQDSASTEELRQAFVIYRELFDEILGEHYEELEQAA
jgi:hypothetical protein